MELAQLRTLYRDMRSKGIERVKFSFSFRGKQFEAIYFIDDKPHSLAIGIRKENFYFEVTVNPGFKIKAFIDNLSEFYRIMGFQSDSANQFHPSVFFQELNNKIPAKINKKDRPESYEIARFRTPAEEPDKVYHIGWRDNDKAGGEVSLENLQKTRELLSYEAYMMCKKKNISSRWSDIPPTNKGSELPY